MSRYFALSVRLTRGVISFVCNSDNDFVELKVLPRRLKMEPSLARFLSG